MNGRSAFWIFIVIAVMAFSIYCYRTRNTYNVDNLTEINKQQDHQIEVLKYALSLIPAELKNQVYRNSIIDKYPDIVSDKELLKMADCEIAKEEKEGEVEIEKKSIEKIKNPSTAMNDIIDAFAK